MLSICFVNSYFRKYVSVLLRRKPIQAPETVSCLGGGSQGHSQNYELFSCSTSESKDNLYKQFLLHQI